MLVRQHDRMQSSADPLSAKLRSVNYAFWGVGLFSLVINLLMLTGPLFMLQVYDRVLTSKSVPTLVALFGLAAAMYMFLGLFDYLRARVLSRIGYWLDEEFAQPSLISWISGYTSGRGDIGRPTADLSQIRLFMSSPGLPALFDLPWVPIYLGIVFLLHFQLGSLALVGAMLVVVIAIANEMLTRRSVVEAVAIESNEGRFAEHSLRNAEAIVAMGMTGNIARHWGHLRNSAKASAQSGIEIGEVFTSTSKALRLLIQSALLGLGGYLALTGKISPGTIVAASILAGRALAPIDQTVGNWRNIARARQAYKRLAIALAGFTNKSPKTELPTPTGKLQVENLLKLAPASASQPAAGRRPILQGLQFELKPGDALGVVGPSASGKSTLARLLVGLTAPDQGSVRLDGAVYDQWDADSLGQHVGYMPQDVELLPGTIKQNIARFDTHMEDKEVIQAAKLAGAHELILGLPDGYDTTIGFGQPPLSGGQAQRVALARALFRQPPLIVLDEPSSNLDAEGEAALTQAIATVRKEGSTVILMTHRPSTLAATNLILMIDAGRQTQFGDKSEVLRKLTRVVREQQTASAAAETPNTTQKSALKSSDESTSGKPEFMSISKSITVSGMDRSKAGSETSGSQSEQGQSDRARKAQ